ncbi:MAG: sn-glycerol-3-phosphate ABC transporter permease UgpE [Labrys sp. (in: a-proteobacteria)]
MSGLVERTPLLNLATHAILIVGLVVLLMPLWIVFVASTHDFVTVNRIPMPLLPGDHLVENWVAAWNKGDFAAKLTNSLIMATGVTVGKIAIAALTAFAIVYFRFPFRMLVFWIIFITLMLPLEVRIVPTYAVAADALRPFREVFSVFGLQVGLPQWNLLNSYTGLILPLVATATGTFLYRQFFLTIPDELVEAAKMDGAGPIRFFIDVLLPLSKTTMAALATILFVYAWNEFLWPLLIITDHATYGVATVELSRLVPGPLFGEPPIWNIAMAGTLIVMIPPLIVVILLQRWFVRGLVASDK